MNAQTQVPATIDSLEDVVTEYNEKIEDIDQLIKDYEGFHDQVNMRSSVKGTYVGRIFNYHPSLHSKTIENNLKTSAWRYAYKRLRIDQLATAKERKQFEMAMENPPEFTMDNLRATFGPYAAAPRFQILKGLAECFADLDPAFKSHSKVKIGVKGLPKRIVLTNCTGYSSWGRERLHDTINALRVFRGQSHLDHLEFEQFLAYNNAAMNGASEWMPGVRYTRTSVVEHDGAFYMQVGYGQASDTLEIGDAKGDNSWRKLDNPEPGLTLKTYKNGNGHLHFSPELLNEINLALAEFYGEVLPDVEGEAEKQRPSTAVSTKLQYFPTPRAVIDRILCGITTRERAKVLEPSCGDGIVMDAVRAWCPTADMVGVEVHPERAHQARMKGHGVMLGNFLETAPKDEYDFVFMNPPFHGTHWKKHLKHARKFLKQRTDGNWRCGTLICILPATAFYDGHLEEMGISERAWTDLPVASFAESGTNVPTGYITIGAGS